MLQKDRDWLARQLKASKKQQRLLRSDMEGRAAWNGAEGGESTPAGALPSPGQAPQSAGGTGVGGKGTRRGRSQQGKGMAGSNSAVSLKGGGGGRGKEHLQRPMSMPELNSSSFGTVADPAALLEGGGGQDSADAEWQLRQEIRQAKQVTRSPKNIHRVQFPVGTCLV